MKWLNDLRGVLWFHEGQLYRAKALAMARHDMETVRLMLTKLRNPDRSHGLSRQKPKSTISNRKDGGCALGR